VPFATAFDAELLLVHVLQPCSLPAEIGYLPPELAVSHSESGNAAREQLDKLCVLEIGARAHSQVQVREGVPWQEIVAAARENDTDLIILATHGRTGLNRVLLGSVTERVVRHATCPVLVVRDQERDFVPALPTEASLSRWDESESSKAPGVATPLRQNRAVNSSVGDQIMPVMASA
jgi:nucleotide-binding universal stress UspA family protein